MREADKALEEYGKFCSKDRGQKGKTTTPLGAIRAVRRLSPPNGI